MKRLLMAMLGLCVLAGCATRKEAPAMESSIGGRREILLTHGWKFVQADPLLGEKTDLNDAGWQAVTVPHTWNNLDGEDGGFEGAANYVRMGCWYRRHLNVTPDMAGKTLVLRFEAANRRTDLFVNGTKIGKHVGGFAAFAFDITKAARTGDNVIAVRVSNEYDDDSAPLSADFTFFGGIYRPVELMVLDPVHISPLDNGSSGVAIRTPDISDASATVKVRTWVRNAGAETTNVRVVTRIVDADGKQVATSDEAAAPRADQTVPVEATLRIAQPHRWNGRKDPYLYQVTADVVRDGAVIDEVTQPLGIRTFSIDKERGFILNGQPYHLHGVNRHQDRPDKGWAISNADHDEDMALIKEMGCTAIRLAHYQHADYFYQLCDRTGIVVWAEVPIVNAVTPGKAFALNAKQQLTELIRQNINHPAICFWSLENEVSSIRGDPVPLFKEMNDLAHKEDPSRLTTMAFAVANSYPREWPGITDTFGKNRYFGWYNGTLADFPKFLKTQGSLAISEYGAGASVYFHSEHPVRMDHSEEYECVFHETYWPAIHERPSVWGSFVWNMFDFSADARKEGDHAGRNNKGLVTYDRKTRKDAFYYYKANWSAEPVIHITSKRFSVRGQQEIAVKVYSNLEEVELFVNGASAGKKTGEYCVFKWENVSLKEGENRVTARGVREGKMSEDTCEWTYRPGAPATVFVAQDEMMRAEIQKGSSGTG